MDATHKHFNKTVLFLATALLMVVPGRAQTFVLNGGGSTITGVTLGNTGAQVSVAGTGDSASNPITFTTTTAYTGANQPGPAWLGVTTGNAGYTTPTTLIFSVVETAGMVGGQTYAATVTLRSTAPATGITATIGVTFTFGTTSSGGTLTPSSSSVALSAASGSSTSTQITLTNNTASTVTFSATATTNSGGSWLTATPSATTVNAGSFVTLTIAAPSGLVLANGPYTGTVTITPSGGTTATIGVTLTVGSSGGTGSLTASINPVSWSYNTSTPTVYPASQTITLTSASGASYYTASVSPSNAWLLANNSATTTSGNFTSGSGTIIIAPNTSYFSSLTTGTIGYVYVTDSNNNPLTITINLSVNGSGSTSGITWLPNPVTLSAAVGGNTTSQVVSLTSTTAGTFTAGISGSGLSISAVSPTTSTTLAYVTVYGVPGTLTANTYYGTLTVYLAPTAGGATVTQTIPVSFVVGSGGTGTTTGVVTPTSLTFAYQTNTSVNSLTLPAQSIAVTGTGALTIGTPAYASGQTGGWLTPTASSPNGPATISVSANPAGLAASTTPYTATVSVTVGSVVSNVTVSFLVTANPVLVAYPGTLTNTYTAGGTNPQWSLFLSASDGSTDNIAVTATTTTTWLSVAGQTSATTPSTVSVLGNNLASLANGVYTGSVTLTATTAASAANSPVNVPVVLTVTGSTATGGGGGLTLSNSSLSFSATQSGSLPASQVLTVSASTNTSYTASVSSTGNWLSISPSGSLTTTANPTLTVSVNQSGLTAAGSPYYGSITLVSNGATQTVQVTLTVTTGSTTGGTGNVTASPTTLSFGTYPLGGNTPSPLQLQVTSASGSAPVTFTISSNATWLSAGVVNGASLNTPVTFTVTVVNPYVSALAPAAYTADITITPSGGTVVTVPVSLTVQAAPAVTVTSATSLSFSYQAGAANPTPATVTVSGGGQALGFTAAVTAGSNWLSVSPTSGTTPTSGTAPLTVTATPGTLGAGQYTGTILVSGSGTAGGSTSITVTLTVTAPLPTINSVVNAASFVRGPVSPGEIVTLFGTSMGPATAAYATINSATGKLATNIGGVQVLFNGIAAPMIYASATQISAIVPYEMAPIASPTVLVQYVGQTSNGYSLTSATTMPGIFTQNASGAGPGAILNQDNSLNGPSNPAAKGSVVQVYMTGEGQTNPSGVTGAITTATLPPPQVTPSPLLPVGVLINGLPALYTYAGEAPGLAAGLMQLNVQIPSTAQSGNLSIQVSVGGNISQTNVTVSVR